MSKNKWINIGIILGILVLAIIIIELRKPNNITTEEIAKCIGETSKIYVQLGCHYCEKQYELFGNYTNYLNKVDCFYEREKCSEIDGTPTWLIKGEYYEGYKDLETLRELTGC
jgi:hypothetical protein